MARTPFALRLSKGFSCLPRQKKRASTGSARTGLLLIALLTTTPAVGQTVATSPAPDSVSVTVYRNPDRNAEQRFDLRWLGGYALITERRTVDIPAGEADIRFEGVAGGILPQSAIVIGLPDGVVEKNQDAWLLSPGSLLDASLGRRVHVRRTSRATGEVTETEAVIRSGAAGAVVLETPAGIESLRCTGLPETLIYRQVPQGLSAKPTLSVRTRGTAAARATLTLSYLASGFDWQADYIAELSRDGKRMDLFAWLTLANGDETGFVRADTQAVAGKVNREDDEASEPQAPPINLECWPQGTTTSDLVEYQPPPPPAIMLEVSARAPDLMMQSPVAITSIGAEQIDLGDLKLYRIPEPVTVAAKSQKQVMLLRHERVPVGLVYRFRTHVMHGDHGAVPTLTTRNRREERLGVPLPAGGVVLFEEQEGRRVLVGEGFLDDRAVGEDVEIEAGASTDVRVNIKRIEERTDIVTDRITVTNAKPYPVRFEARIDEDRSNLETEARLAERDGSPLWAVTVPANGTRTLTYRIRTGR
jgi:hypothetical protein